MNKKELMKIIVPLCIALAIGGIWILKNADGNPEAIDFPDSSGDALEPVADETNEDFALEASSIDLESLLSYDLPVVIDFGADTCTPCKEMAPVLKTLNTEMLGKAIIKFVDVWKNEGAAKDFPIQTIPTQMLFNADGTPYVPGETIDILFDMYSYNDTGEHAFTVHQGGLTEEELRTILADMGVSE